jgi:UDP-N-acetylglucosamine 2-epimerase
MAESFRWAIPFADRHLPEAARGLAGYVLVTLHRAENVDDPQRLASLLALLEIDRPVIFPVHPRTRAALAGAGLELPPNVRAIDPVGYLAMVALESRAAVIATDSGGVQKEAYLAGVPCITLRTETEWVETVAAGWNRVVGAQPDALRAALEDASFVDRARARPELFGDRGTSQRIVAALAALDRRHGALSETRLKVASL